MVDAHQEIRGGQDEEDDGFEISDGDVSEHSESSHDRTRGVKSFKVSDVANEQFGKPSGLATDGGTGGGDVLRERPTVSDEDAGDEDDDDDARTESSPRCVEMRESPSESDVRDVVVRRRAPGALVSVRPMSSRERLPDDERTRSGRSTRRFSAAGRGTSLNHVRLSAPAR